MSHIGNTVIYIKDPTIRESSGVCRSINFPGLYWTHNDSGSAPTIHLFDLLGNVSASFPLLAKALDCEDISSAIVGGVPTVIVADTGDNNCLRQSYRILVMKEPSINAGEPLKVATIDFKYPDGKRRNCEACALLPDGRILLVTKSYPSTSGQTSLFIINSWLSNPSAPTNVIAGPRFSPSMGNITAMDSKQNDDGSCDVVLMGNGKAWIYHNVDWSKPNESFAAASRIVPMPKSYQPEAICWSYNSSFLVMTSETNKTSGALTPIYTIPI